DRPLRGEGAVAFVSPPTLRHEVELPNLGRVTGMGIPEGVTLVVGGGFHGKSTLLRALERGVYDHIPGDGRELVVARPDATKVRAEDGRRVERVDVSSFVGRLPSGRGTSDFSTDNASGSTSQAASMVEALEAGARVLLVDEDTAATNLMIRDLRMQELVAKDREPLTPFVDLVRPLHREHGVSSVLVVGGSGDYFDVADHVLLMDAFRPREVTDEARRIAARWPGRRAEAASFAKVRHRVPDPASIDPRRGGRIKTRARGTSEVQFGSESIDLSGVAQIVDPSQTVGVALALARLRGFLDGERTLAQALELLYDRIASDGIDVLRRDYPGDLALPRALEVAAALNRLRSLRVLRFS
ncbi:MAG: ABC-ATPase domain-containing protein, partial [Actinomycetota bacterium]|nr:ABC-ATPase domain-containing protein [Actinomycetota bacterium]